MKQYAVWKVLYWDFESINNILFENDLSDETNIDIINDLLFDIYWKKNIIDNEWYIEIVLWNNGYPNYSLIKIIDKLYISDIYSPLMENNKANLEQENSFWWIYRFDTFPMLMEKIHNIQIIEGEY